MTDLFTIRDRSQAAVALAQIETRANRRNEFIDALDYEALGRPSKPESRLKTSQPARPFSSDTSTSPTSRRWKNSAPASPSHTRARPDHQGASPVQITSDTPVWDIPNGIAFAIAECAKSCHTAPIV